MHKHGETENFRYIEVTKNIFVGLSKCCRTTFALVEGKKADINLQEIETNSELLLAGANFINNLINQKIKVYVNYEDEKSKGINLVVAYLIKKTMRHHTLKGVVCKGARFLDAQDSNRILKDAVFVKNLDIIRGLSVDKAISMIEKKIGINLNPDIFNKFKEFLKEAK